mgnify:CR=1 FL=1
MRNPRSLTGILALCLLSVPCVLESAEVVITLPDHRLRYVLDTLCWVVTKCEAVDEMSRAKRVADAIVRIISAGRYDKLEQLEGIVTIRHADAR